MPTNPVAADPLEAFVGCGAMFDTAPFRTNGPNDCGIDGDTPERVSAFEAMGRGWRVTPREVTQSTSGVRTPIVAPCRETLAAARALAS